MDRLTPLEGEHRGLIAGVLVGGEGRRMGGQAKGLLRAPSGESILDRWASIFDGLGIERVLVGTRPEYAALDWRYVEDDPCARGPLAGLLGLLAVAGDGRAIAVACDMPHVSADLVKKLVEAPHAPIVAPRHGGHWEPLFALYDAPSVLPIARLQAKEDRMALQALLDRAGAAELAMADTERRSLRDWDAPEDIDR